ncbi:MAG: DegT/DnrJ/EryC1/StrS family aminotransferase [Bryobacteraceae bacterium]|nr:DegT/DnrJ/EryC1/StrS family aminotransferase [Bryobacteraceae bacterium]
MSAQNIPFHLASIGEEEIQEVAETLRSGWFTTGGRTAQFEADFRAYTGAPFALAVNSCTAGLHLALHALGIGPGDEVITTPLTFCATVNTILHVGAQPVLADIDEYGNLCLDSVRRRITRRTRAIMPVHFAGASCDMTGIWKLARQYGLLVIEDAAHATSTHYRGTHIGGSDPQSGLNSDAVAYSFYATKSLATGEGGMVTTHRQELNDRMRILCLHGISRDAWNRYTEKGKWFYEVVECGFKYNLSDLQSAIGIHQLRKQERFRARREEIATLYSELLAAEPDIETPRVPDYTRHAWHLYVARVGNTKAPIDRAAVIDHLRAAGIGCSVHFIPVPAHPYYQRFAWADPALVPRAMELYPRILSLPIYPGLTDEEVIRVADGLTAAVRAQRGVLTATTV